MPCSGPRAPLALRSWSRACGDGQGVGIEFDHAVDGRPAAVDCFDPGHVFLGEGVGGKFSGCHARLEIGDGELVELEACNLGRGGRGGGHSRGRRQRWQQGGADSADDSSLKESTAGRHGISGKVFSGLRKAGLLFEAG